MRLRRPDTAHDQTDRTATYDRARTLDGSNEGSAQVFRARGGISGGAIMTGVVVAFGAMLLLGALIGAGMAALGTLSEVGAGEALEVGIGAGLAFVIAQFLSYLWGGYTAGRMGRGAGAINGLLVAVVALLLGAVAAGVASALGAAVNLNLPFAESRLGIDGDRLVDWGLGIGIATLVAMVAGAVVGGFLGSRWHTKLEHRTLEDREIDLRDRTPNAPAGQDRAPGTGQEQRGDRRTTTV